MTELAEQARARGHRLDARAVTGSTNDDAAAALRAGDPGGLWVVAGRQEKGRGRQGRAWASPEGNLHASLAARAPCERREAPQLGFLAGLALREAALDLAPGAQARLRLKWPNDLLLDGAKCAGVLLEATSLPDGSLGVVFGFGVDVAHAPDDAPYPAARLVDIAPGASAPALFRALSRRMAERLDAFAAADPRTRLARLREEWLAAAARLGERVAARRGERRLEGRFVGLDEFGRLLLETPSGVERIEAGDLEMARD